MDDVAHRSCQPLEADESDGDNAGGASDNEADEHLVVEDPLAEGPQSSCHDDKDGHEANERDDALAALDRADRVASGDLDADCRGHLHQQDESGETDDALHSDLLDLVVGAELCRFILY